MKLSCPAVVLVTEVTMAFALALFGILNSTIPK